MLLLAEEVHKTLQLITDHENNNTLSYELTDSRNKQNSVTYKIKHSSVFSYCPVILLEKYFCLSTYLL